MQVSCGEGGCGSCTVILGTYNARQGDVSFAPINSCLRPLCSVDGCAIITVEGEYHMVTAAMIQDRY